MNFFARAWKFGLVGLAVVVSVLAPVSGLHAQDAKAPELGTSAARLRRPWFSRQLAKLLAQAPEQKDAVRVKLMDDLLDRVRKQSAETRATIQARSGQKLKSIFDVVVIGGGIHAAIFNSALTHAFPEARVLTIEATDTLVKTFNGSGPVFRINSPELGTATANLIQESPVQLAQLTPAKFANAELLGQVAAMALFHSSTNFLLNAKVSTVQSAGDAYYAVRLEEGLIVYARHVVVATGLGAPALKAEDPATLALVRQESTRKVELGKEVPDIQFFDDAVVKAKLALDMDLKPLDAYAGKTVAIVGAGDAGNVFVEFLLGHAPPEVYARTKVAAEPKKTIWIGQKSRNYDEWKAANKARYHEPLKDLYNDRRIEMTAGKLEWIRASDDAAKGKFVLLAKTDQEETRVYADKVVISTGYFNLAPDLCKNVGPGVELKPMQGTVKGIDHPSSVSLQVRTSDGKAHRVYVIGPAAAPLATDEEVKLTITKNHHSINVLGPRTEALALMLANSLMGN